MTCTDFIYCPTQCRHYTKARQLKWPCWKAYAMAVALAEWAVGSEKSENVIFVVLNNKLEISLND